MATIIDEQQQGQSAVNPKAANQFLGNFWGPDERGFYELLQRMKVAKHTCVELLSFISSRIEMEEDYAKKMVKLAKSSSLGKDEEGQKSLDAFKAELEQRANTRTAMADEMRKKLEAPLNELMNKHRDARKQHQSALEKTIKNKQSVEQNLQKLEEKYRQKKQEMAELHEAKANARPGKELDKIVNKIGKNIQTMQQIEKEYAGLSGKYREIHAVWLKEMTGACIDFQRLEEERLDYVRKWLWDYANMGSQACVADDDSHERLRTSLEGCDVQFDIREFIAKHATGPDIPPLPDKKNLTDDSGEKERQERVRLSMRPNPAQAEIPPGSSPAPVKSEVATQEVLRPASNPFFEEMDTNPAVAPAMIVNPLVANTSATQNDKVESQFDKLSLFSSTTLPPPTIPNVGVNSRLSVFESSIFGSRTTEESNYLVRVIQNYDAEDNEELTLDIGQTVKVIGNPKPGYYLGELQIGKHKSVGLVPTTVVERVQ